MLHFYSHSLVVQYVKQCSVMVAILDFQSTEKHKKMCKGHRTIKWLSIYILCNITLTILYISAKLTQM